MTRLYLCLLLSLWSGQTFLRAGAFEVLGNPVKSALILNAAVGQDIQKQEVLYFNCARPGSRLFLLQVNPATGETHQYDAPIGEGARSMLVASNGCVYLGTWEGGYLLRFDPQHPEQGLVSLGKPSPTETYLWQMASDQQGRIYGCTYPQARLVRHDPATGQSEDLGRLDEKEMYGRNIATDHKGFLYVGIGTVRAQVVCFDPATGEKRPLWPEAERPPGTAQVWTAKDGLVYGQAGTNRFRCEADRLVRVKEVPEARPIRLRNGSMVTEWNVEAGQVVYTLLTKAGRKQRKTAEFNGSGLRLFSVGAGPGGRVYASTVLPQEVFNYLPATGTMEHLGTFPGAEVYSFANDGSRLYAASYPRSYLCVYDPEKAWNFGTKAKSNPRGLGYMGDGHLRPRALVVGPAGRVYVGSLAPYGQVGGALGIYDSKSDQIVENYRHVVTNQGVATLCYEPVSGKIFGGSSIEAGGGARPVAKECAVFAWDPTAKRKLWETNFVAGDTIMAAMTAAQGKVFCISRPSQTLVVLDGVTGREVRRAKVPYGNVLDGALTYYAPHDLIYGLGRSNLFQIHPKTYEIKEVAKYPAALTCGLAVTDAGIYFGATTNLVRWKW